MADTSLLLEPPQARESMLVEAGLLEAAQLGVDTVDGEQVEHGDDGYVLPLPIGDFFQGYLAILTVQGASGAPFVLEKIKDWGNKERAEVIPPPVALL